MKDGGSNENNLVGKMSTNLTNSIGKENEDQQNTSSNVVKTGYLRKLKTMKKKYFVLLNDSNDGFARLEYYDSEKKFKTNLVQPKRSIVLKTCFSISKKVDAKHKYAIALYTKEDCFVIVYDDEEQMNDWLKVMVDLQSQSQNNDSKQRLRKSIDFIWQVNILKNGLGQAINMIGVYRLCLTSQSIYLVKMNCEIEDVQGSSEIPLISIRRLAHASNVGALMIELGRSAPFGPGELWIQAEDSTVAHHMHEVIIKAMKATTVNEEFGTSHMRPRSASTSENSKPIAHRRPQNVQIHPNKSLKQANVGSSMTGQSNLTSYSSIRERCDSMPSSSRNKIDKEKDTSHRPHQISYHNRTQSYSPPSQNPLSPSSCACSTDSAGSSLSIDENENADYFIVHHNVPLEPSIKEEEQIDENHYFIMNPSKHSIQQTDERTSRATVNVPQSILNDAKNNSDESGYLLMNPGLNNQTKNFHLENNENSLNLTSEYVDMIPSNRKERSNREDDFYDFTPMSSSLPKSHDLTLSNSFQQQLENSLEKVKSYFDKKADEPMDYIKPVRAYSIGSRPQQQSIFSKKVYLNPNQKPNSSETDYFMTSFGSITGKKEDLHLQQLRTRAHTYGQDAKLLRARIAAQKKAAQSQISKSNSNSLNETPEHLSLSSDSFTLTPVSRNRSSTIGSRPIEKPIAENVSPQNQTSSSESETASSSGLSPSNTPASAESSSNTVQSASPTSSSSSNLNSSSQDYVEICPKNVISHNVSYAEIEFNNSTKIDSTRK